MSFSKYSLHHFYPLCFDGSNKDSNLISLRHVDHTQLHRILDPKSIDSLLAPYTRAISSELLKSPGAIKEKYNLLRCFFANYLKLGKGLRLTLASKMKHIIIDHLESYESMNGPHPYFTKSIIKSIDCASSDFNFNDLLEIDYKIVQGTAKKIMYHTKIFFPSYKPYTKNLNPAESSLIIPFGLRGRYIVENYINPEELSTKTKKILVDKHDRVFGRNKKLQNNSKICKIFDNISSIDTNFHALKRKVRIHTNDKFILNSSDHAYRLEFQHSYFEQLFKKLHDIEIEDIGNHLTVKMRDQALFDRKYYIDITGNECDVISDKSNFYEYHKISSEFMGQLGNEILATLENKYFFINR